MGKRSKSNANAEHQRMLIEVEREIMKRLWDQLDALVGTPGDTRDTTVLFARDARAQREKAKKGSKYPQVSPIGGRNG